MMNQLPKSLLLFAEYIEDYSDEVGSGDGYWVYPVEATEAAQGICAPNTLHEYTLTELVSQLRKVRAEIRLRRKLGIAPMTEEGDLVSIKAR